MKKLFLISGFLVSTFWSVAQDTIKLDSTTLVTRTLVQDLVIPWDLHWAPDGWIWFNERDGDIYRLHPDSLTLIKVFTIPDVYQSEDNSGSHGFALHPDFPFSPYAYAHYTNELFNSKLVRFTYSFEQETFVDSTVLIPKIGGSITHNGSRIVFDENNLLYLSIGDAYENENAYDINDENGKILRCTEDGEIPEDNPFPNSYTYSLGHRNPQGLVFGKNGLLYSSEHGDATDDEVNLIEKGRNYGWPLVEGFCDTPSEQQPCDSMNVREPLMVWTPTYAPGGLAYFDHPSIPEWRNCLMQAFLKRRMLTVMPLTDDGLAIKDNQRWEYLTDRFGRLRDVLVTPNGRIFIATSNQETNGQWVTPDNYDKIIEIKNLDYEYASGVAEPPVLSSRIFPNPAESGRFWMSIPTGDTDLEIRITDIKGNIVFYKTLTSYYPGLWHIESNISQDGIYIVNYATNSANGAEKIVIVK